MDCTSSLIIPPRTRQTTPVSIKGVNLQIHMRLESLYDRINVRNLGDESIGNNSLFHVEDEVEYSSCKTQAEKMQNFVIER